MKKIKIPKYLTRVYPILIALGTLIMGIGYASTNITLDITGTLIAQAQKEVIITNVNCDSEENTGITINSYTKTILESSITLSDTDITSSISCTITVKNNTNDNYAFKDIVYGSNFYDNNDIIIASNLEKKAILPKNQSTSFTINFKYKDNLEQITNNTLNSILNLKFEKYYIITYENIENNNYPTIIFNDENLEITFKDDIPDNILVTNVTNYNYETPKLTINMPTNNVVITGISSGIIYSRHYDQLVLDGTKNSVINTGINLYSEENVNKNFRITFTIDDYDSSYENTSNVNQQTIFNCKNEAVSSVWPGIMLRLGKSSGTTKYEFGMKDSHLTTSYKTYDLEKGIKVSIIRENGKIYLNWNSIKHTLIYTYKDTIDTFDVPLTFGGIINSSGEYERIFKGTLSNITIELYEGERLDEINNIQSSYVETKEENLYKLDGIIYFNGTNYIDTGINLFSTENGNKDFDITFNLEDIGNNSSQATLVNAKNESDNSYPGFAYRYENSKMNMTARWPGQINVSQTDSSTKLPRKISISRRNGIIYYKIGSSIETVLIETPMESLIKTFGVNLTFGASINSSGNPFRYFNGYVSDINVQVYDN